MRYALRTKHGLRFKWPRSVILLVIGVALTCLALYAFTTRTHAPAPTKQAPKAQAVTPPKEGLVSNIMFVGDVFWGRSVQTKAEKSGQSYQYITSGLSAADRSQYDAWIANFECPVTTKDVPYQLQVDILKFNCRPEYLPELAKWFTAASQANNHTMNNDGQWGVEQTRISLESAGMQYFGNYDMDKVSDICEVITVPAKTTATNKTVSLPVALCGYMYVVDVAPTEAQLTVMQSYAKVMPVIAMPHMGVEYRATAEEAKVSAYHRMIDNGADAVIAAHPHVIQNSEAYKGKLIAYSLGNFLFDQKSHGRDTTLGLAIGLKLTINDDAAAKVYESVAPSCKAYKDDCVAKLSAKLKTRPSITVAYNFTCYDEASGVPKLGTDAVCADAKKSATVDALADLHATW